MSVLLKEGFVIVASILLAFGIDARWELARERSEAEALIEALRADFVTTVAEAERVVGNHGGGAEAAEVLIQMAEAGAVTAADGPRVDSLFSIMRVSGASFDPPLGTVEMMLQTGRLSAIADRELAALLTAWPADVGDLKGQEEALISPFDELEGALRAEGVRTDWLLATDHTGAEFGDVPWERRPTETWRILNDDDVRVVLAANWLALSFTTISAERRLEGAQRILELLGG